MKYQTINPDQDGNNELSPIVSLDKGTLIMTIPERNQEDIIRQLLEELMRLTRKNIALSSSSATLGYPQGESFPTSQNSERKLTPMNPGGAPFVTAEINQIRGNLSEKLNSTYEVKPNSVDAANDNGKGFYTNFSALGSEGITQPTSGPSEAAA